MNTMQISSAVFVIVLVAIISLICNRLYKRFLVLFGYDKMKCPHCGTVGEIEPMPLPVSYYDDGISALTIPAPPILICANCKERCDPAKIVEIEEVEPKKVQPIIVQA